MNTEDIIDLIKFMDDLRQSQTGFSDTVSKEISTAYTNWLLISNQPEKLLRKITVLVDRIWSTHDFKHALRVPFDEIPLYINSEPTYYGDSAKMVQEVMKWRLKRGIKAIT